MSDPPRFPRRSWRGNLPAGSIASMELVQVGERAPDPVVLTTEGDEVRLSTFWERRPAVLAFLRHFG